MRNTTNEKNVAQDLLQEWLALKTLTEQEEFANKHGLKITFITEDKKSDDTKDLEKGVVKDESK